MTPKAYVAALVVVAIWGFNFVVVKTGVTAMPPLFFTAIRFAGVALLLAPFFRPARSTLKGILLLSVVLGVLHFGLLFTGLSGVDAATGAIAIQLTVPFSAIMAAVFFNDRLGWKRGAGMLLAFGGVAVLAGEPTLPQPLPLVLVVLSALAWAVAQVVIKRIGAINPLALNGWVALFAAPQLFVLSLLLEEGQVEAAVNAPWQGWAAWAYVVFGASLLAYTLWYRLIATYDINRIVPFTLLAPFIGVFAGVMVLGEPFTIQKVIGGALTIVGVAIIQMRTRKRVLVTTRTAA